VSKNLEQLGIKVYSRFDIEKIKTSPPTSSFVVFSLNRDSLNNFITELKNEQFLERLPYRLFITCSDSDGELKDINNDPLLQKRIAVLSKDEFNSIYNLLKLDNPKEAVVSLYSLWLKHLCKIKRFNISNFEILIKKDDRQMNSQTSSFIPREVTDKYEVIKNLFPSESQKNNSESIEFECCGLHFKIKEIEIDNSHIKYKSSGSEITDFSNKIIYCRHQQKKTIEKKNPFYYEAFSGDSISFPILFWCLNDETEKKIRACLLVENALLGLVVADERIANRVKSNPERYSKCNLYIVDIFKGDKEVYVLKEKQQKDRLLVGQAIYKLEVNEENVKLKKVTNTSEKEETIARPSILLIHQGILDKAFQDTSSKALEEKIYILKKKFPFIVVTSGRGKPGNIPQNTKFLLLSDLMVAFRKNEYPDKLGIVNILMNMAGG